MARSRVAIGATFACDDALDLPLQLLLREIVGASATDAAPVDVEWLPYGSAAQLGALTSSFAAAPTTPTTHSSRKRATVDLVLLLVRVSDLEAAHPEQQRSASYESAQSPVQSATLLTPSLEQFAVELEQYCNSPEVLPPLVVFVTPSAPEHMQRSNAVEQQLRARLVAANASPVAADPPAAVAAVDITARLRWLPSTHVLELFALHNTSTSTSTSTSSNTSRLDISDSAIASESDRASDSTAAANAAYYDHMADQLEHAPYTQRMLNAFALALCRECRRLLLSAQANTSRIVKALVLDCDNTLWGGAVAERGALGVSLLPPFQSLQRFVVAQQQRGCVVCLCSKNVAADVVSVFETRKADMVLDFESHVAATRINWERKSQNIRGLATELGFGLDAFVFIDDSPIECSEVASALPDVAVVCVPNGFGVNVLDHEWVFDGPLLPVYPTCRHTNNCNTIGNNATKATFTLVTKEDVARTRMYQQHATRQALARASSSHSAFVSSLNVKIVFETLADGAAAPVSDSFTRVLQLHARTNQFNAATTFSRGLTPAILQQYVRSTTGSTSASAAAVCAHVTDRFGHYGLVGVVLCRLVSDDNEPSTHTSRSLFIDSFLVSCRALNRGVEHALLSHVGVLAQQFEATCVAIAWEPTVRNEPARQFFSALAPCAFIRAADATAPFASRQYATQQSQTRTTKLEQSATSSGTWVLETHAAVGITFLKTDSESESEASTDVPPAAAPAAPVAPVATQSTTTRPLALLCERFREHEALNAFIAAHTGLAVERDNSSVRTNASGGATEPLAADPAAVPKRPVLSTGSTCPKTYLTEQETSKFRRKARHRTKLALQQHVAADAPTTIWSANQRHVSATNSSSNPDMLTLESQAHVRCATPQCRATMSNPSACGFQRCRTCCYKIQRLLGRMHSHVVHPLAQQAAAQSLTVQFHVAVDSVRVNTVDEDESGQDDGVGCQVHTNERRRR